MKQSTASAPFPMQSLYTSQGNIFLEKKRLSVPHSSEPVLLLPVIIQKKYTFDFRSVIENNLRDQSSSHSILINLLTRSRSFKLRSAMLLHTSSIIFAINSLDLESLVFNQSIASLSPNGLHSSIESNICIKSSRHPPQKS